MTPYNYINYHKPYRPNYQAQYRSSSDDGRGLLLPFLVGAAVAFPIGYIASNTNKNQQGAYPYPVYQQPYPVYQQPYPVYQQPAMNMPYQQMPYPQYSMPMYP